MLITGDFNSDLNQVSNLQDYIGDGKLLDLGATASAYGGEDNEPTCQINASAKPTGRDYILANPAAFKLITKFEVDRKAGLLVHAVLRVQFSTEPPRPQL